MPDDDFVTDRASDKQPSRSDQELTRLLEAAQQGDQEAWCAIFDEFHVPLRARLRRIGIPADRVEDYVHGALLGLMTVKEHRGERPNSRSGMLKYLKAVGRHQWYKVQKQRKKERPLIADNLPAEDRVLRREASIADLIRAVRDAVEELDEELANMLRLYVVLKSIPRVAEQLGVECRHVRYRLGQVVPKLRRWIRRERPDLAEEFPDWFGRFEEDGND